MDTVQARLSEITSDYQSMLAEAFAKISELEKSNATLQEDLSESKVDQAMAKS